MGLLRWRIVKRRSVRPSTMRIAYERHKSQARAVITAAVIRYATHYGFTYKRIAIRNTRHNWGSCSALGNLNFSYKLLFLPPCLRNYIVVHELCHLRQLNHSAHFWDEVATIMPDYKERIQTLRRIEKTVGTSLAALEKQLSLHDPKCLHCLCDRELTLQVKEKRVSSVLIDETIPTVAVSTVLEV